MKYISFYINIYIIYKEFIILFELQLLKVLLQRSVYENYRSFVDKKDFAKELLVVLDCIDELHREGAETISVPQLAPLVFSKTTDIQYYNGVLSSLETQEAPESVKTLLERFKTRRVCEDLSLVAYEAARGSKEVSEVFSIVEKLKNPTDSVNIEYITDDLDEILSDTVRTPGLRWRLQSLNRSLGSLRVGDFGFLFARPETCKTTFLASEVSYMAEQAKKNGLGPVLFINNEEQGKKVKLRIYQGVLGARVDHLLQAPERAKAAYSEKVGTHIKLYDSATIDRYFVNALCQKEKPSLIVFDQLDKISGFKADRPDLILGEVYIWARELAKQYCPVIGVCQADGTAEGIKWLEMSHIANSKTSKSAEADWILGIGKSPDDGYEFVRYFHLCKNKLTGDADTESNLRHAKWEVLIRPEIARLEDI